MTVEFSRSGNIYQCSVTAPAEGPPRTIQIPFRPCLLKPAFVLELRWKGSDAVRGIEVYVPVREIHT